MKSYYKIFMGTLMCFLMIVLACDKEVHVIDGFDFDLSETHTVSGFIYERNQTDFKISVKQKIASTAYTFSFSSMEGKGYFESSDGKKIEEGQEYSIKDLDWRMNYLSQEIGKNKVKVVVKDNKGFSKEKILEYDIDHAPFTFVISPKANSYIINAKNAISVSLFRDSETKEENPFSINYYVDNGSAQIIQNDSIANKETIFKPGRKYDLLEGTSLLDYLPSTIGKHTLHATAIAPDGAKRTTELDLEVRHLKFDLSTTGESNQLAVNKEYGLTVNLTNEDPKSDVSYQMLFEYGQNTSGVVKLSNEKGIEVTPGVYVPILPNTYKYKFSTGDIGRKNLQFTVKDSNGQIKKDSVVVDVETIPLIFKGSPESNVVYINQPTQFNFELTPQGDAKDIKYALQFDATNGDGTLYQNGKTLEPTFPYMVEPGSFQYVYKPSTLGDHNINFTVTDSNNQAVNVTIKVKSKHVELNLNASAAETNMIVGNSNDINVSLIENNEYIGVTYELSHFITGGTARLEDQNGLIEPSKYHAFNPGSHVFKFIPELPGTYEINFILRDSNKQIIERTVRVLAGGTDFEFRATETSNSMALGQTMDINFAITPNTDENRSSYTMIYEKTNNGELTINGISIAPGEKFEITTKTFKGIYMPKETGSHNLEFTVTDTQGVVKSDKATINVSNGTFEFVASSSPSNILINEVGNINFNLSQSVENLNAKYELYYELVGPNGTITDSEGKVIEAGVFVPINLGQFTWNFASKNEGAYSVNFTVRDNTGNTATDNVLFEVDGNSFNFNVQPSVTSATVFDPISMNMDITETAQNSGETYQLRFASDVNAVVEYQGKRYTPGQAIDVPVGEFQVDYIGNKFGNHNISFTVMSSSQSSITRDVSVDISQILFDFIASAQNNTIYKGFATDLNFNISETGANSTYQMRYVINGINADVLDETGTILSPGTYYPVTTGNFNWELLANSSGVADLTFYVKNASELEQSKKVSVNVLNGDYNFETITSQSSLEVNESGAVNLIFSEVGKSQAPYRVFYSTSKEGVLTVNSVSYAPGQTFEIDGSTEVSYTGLVPGGHDIAFTVVSSTGNRKQDAVSIAYNGGSYDLVATAQSNTIYRSGNTDINFELTEKSNPTTYRMRYAISGGNGKMKGINETTLSAGTFYEILPGQFTWNFSADVVGDYEITFYTENAAGVEVINTIQITVQNEDYTLDVISSDTSLEVNEQATISFKIAETGASRAPYSVYFKSPFKGEISYNGNTYGAGDTFEIDGSTDVLYTGLVPGGHDIAFTVVSSTGNKKEKAISIAYNGGSYDLVATAQSNTIYRSGNTDINFELTEESNPTTYRMRFAITGGNGTIIDQSGGILAAGAFYEIVPGQFTWNFSADVVGDYEITFYAENAAGIDKTIVIPVAVQNEDYTLDIISSDTSLEVNEQATISFKIAETGASRAPYSVYFKSPFKGEISYNGNTYGAGDTFEIDGSTDVLYTGLVPGGHDIAFTVVSSTGNKKEKAISIAYNGGSYDLVATAQSNTIYRSGNTDINFELTEESNPTTYRMRFAITGGNGTIIDQSGGILAAGAFYEIVPGQFTWNFSADVVGDYEITFYAENAAGIDKTIVIPVAVQNEDYTLDIISSDTSLEVNEQATISFKIAETGASRAPYSVYFNSPFKGEILYKGNKYTSGQTFEIDGSTEALYTGLVPGVHDIAFTVVSSTGNEKKANVSLTYHGGDYIITATPEKNTIFRKELIDLNFQLSEKTNPSTYEMMFVVNNGAATIKDAAGTTLSSGTYYKVEEGSFKWNLVSDFNGSLELAFFVRNAAGVERSDNVEVLVLPDDYEFKATASTQNTPVNSLIDVNYILKENGPFAGPYFMHYESSKDIIFTYNEVSLSPGSQFEIEPGNSLAVVKGLDVGVTDITFYVVSSTGVKREQTVSVDFTGATFAFNGTAQTNSIYKTETTDINFQITETGGTSNYQLLYYVNIGDGKLIDQNGIEVPRGTYIDVPKGTFKWTFVGTSVGQVELKFTARNHLDVDQSITSIIEVKKTDFELEAIPSANNQYVYKKVPVNFSINQKGAEGISYEMRFISDGDGKLIYNGRTYGQGETIKPLSKGNFQAEYLGNKVGKHNINFIVSATNGVSRSKAISINFNKIEFDLLVSANPPIIYKTESSEIRFNIKEVAGGDDTYKMMYEFEEGRAIIKNQNGITLSPNVEYNVSKDQEIIWDFIGNVDNDVRIKFTASNTSGAVKSKTIDIYVLKTDFTFTANITKEVEFLRRSVPVNFNITQKGSELLTYNMTFSVLGGSGNIVYKGTKYGPGTTIENVPLGAFSGTYTGNSLGEHKVTFNIIPSNDNPKSKLDAITIKKVDFSFIGSPTSSSIFKEESTDLNFTITEEVGGNDTYTMYYEGIGVIKVNGITLSKSTPITVKNGSFKWNYTGNIVGKQQVKFTVENSTGTLKTITIPIEVKETDFDFTVSKVKAEDFVNTPVRLNFDVRSKGQENLTYTMKYDNNGSNGRFIYNGKTYEPGVSFNVVEGEFPGEYVGYAKGTHSIKFTVLANNGISKEASESIKFTPVEFAFDIEKLTLEIFKSESAEIGFRITELNGGKDNYTMSYQITSTKGGTLKTTSGTILDPLKDYTVNPGSLFKWIFEGTTVGDIKVAFTVKNKSGGAPKTKTVTIKVKPIEFNFTAIAPSPSSVYVNKSTQIGFKIDELQTGIANYTMSYEIISSTYSGTGTLKTGSGIELKPFTDYKVVPNETFNWVFEGITEGDVKIKFTVKNDSGGTSKNDNVTIKVMPTKVSVNPTVSGYGILNKPKSTSFYLSHVGVDPSDGITYKMRFSSTGTGELIYKGITYQEGQDIPIELSGSSGEYIGKTKGSHKISYTVYASNGAQSTESVTLDIKAAEFTLDVIKPTSKLINGKQSYFNLKLFIKEAELPDHKDVDYFMRYTLSSPNAGTFKYLSNTYQEGQTIPLQLNFLYATNTIQMPFMANTDLENFSITFEIFNSFGGSATKTVTVDMYKIPILYAKGTKERYGQVSGTHENNLYIEWPGSVSKAFDGAYIKTLVIRVNHKNDGWQNMKYDITYPNNWTANSDQKQYDLCNCDKTLKPRENDKGKYLVVDQKDKGNDLDYTTREWEMYIIDSNGVKSKTANGKFIAN